MKPTSKQIRVKITSYLNRKLPNFYKKKKKSTEIVTIDDDYDDDDHDLDDKNTLLAILASFEALPIDDQAPSPLHPNEIASPVQTVPGAEPPPNNLESHQVSLPPSSNPATGSIATESQQPNGGEESDDDVVFVSSEFTHKTPTPPNMRIKKLVKFQCPNCSEEFEQKEEVGEHISRVHSGKGMKCKLCGEIVSDTKSHLKKCVVFLNRRKKKTLESQETVPMELERDENLLVPMEEHATTSTSGEQHQARSRRSSEDSEYEIVMKPITKRRNTSYFAVLPWETDVNQEVIQAAGRRSRSKSVYQPEPEPLAEKEKPQPRRGRPRSKSVYEEISSRTRSRTRSHARSRTRRENVIRETVGVDNSSEVRASNDEPTNFRGCKEGPLQNVSNMRNSKQMELT
jgi:hypothetical protein